MRNLKTVSSRKAKRNRLHLLSLIFLGMIVLPQLYKSSEESSDSDDDSSATSSGGSSSSSSSDGSDAQEFDAGLDCNRGFLNSYGIDGVNDAHVKGMTLCPDITYSCCSPIDELKFHKNWFHYYKPKLKITHHRMIHKIHQLSQLFIKIKAIEFKDIKNLILTSKKKEAKELHKLIAGTSVDPELRPLIDELEKQLGHDTKQKQGVFCLLCDYNNHEYFGLSGRALLVQKKSCQELITDNGLLMKINAKLLYPLLLRIHRFLSCFGVNYYDRKDWELVGSVRESRDDVDRCFPEENTEYDFDSCRDVCEKWTFLSESQVVMGEFPFYEYLLKRGHKWEEWLVKAIENPKIFFRNEVVKEEEVVEDGVEIQDAEIEEEDNKEEQADEKEEIGERILARNHKKALFDEEEDPLLNLADQLNMVKQRQKIVLNKKMKLQKRSTKGILTYTERHRIHEQMEELEEKLAGYGTEIKKMKKKSRKMLKRKEIRQTLNKERKFFRDKNSRGRRRKHRKLNEEYFIFNFLK